MTGELALCAGGLTVIIEARIDLRDSTGWDTLDRAITRLGGAASVAGAAADAGAAAATAAAAAAVSAVSPADSDDEDAAGECLVLMKLARLQMEGIGRSGCGLVACRGGAGRGRQAAAAAALWHGRRAQLHGHAHPQPGRAHC